MSRIITLAFKDLTVLRREKEALFWIFLFPLVFALFFGFLSGGGGGDRGKLRLAVVDEDHSDGSRALLDKLRKSDSLALYDESVVGTQFTAESARNAVRRGDLTAFLVVPKGYGETAESFWQEGKPLELGIDPARTAEAGMLDGVLMQTIYSGMQDQFTDPKKAKANADKALAALDKASNMDPDQKKVLKSFLGDLEKFMGNAAPQEMKHSPFAIENKLKKVPVLLEEENKPRSAFEVTFPSSVTWGMYGCIITFAISIVSERTKGTLIRLRMSPLSWAEIVAGKGLACFLVSVFVAALLMFLGHLLFGIRVENLVGLALAIVSAAFCYTGLMMALAGFGKTEKAVSGSAAAVFMPLAMIGGGMIPLAFMPAWMQTVSNISPTKWNIVALEGAIWRGTSLVEMLLPCGVLLAIGAAGFGLGVRFLSRQKT
jgi:ABC-2 type transport system permease protein